MDISRDASIELGIGEEEIGARLRGWASAQGFEVARSGPPAWRFRRGSRLAAAFRFDLRKVPTEVAVRAEGAGPLTVSCSIRVKSALQLETKRDREAVERQLEALLAALRGEPAAAAAAGGRRFRLWPVLAVAVVVAALAVWVAENYERAPSSQPTSAEAKFRLFDRAKRATVLVYGEEDGPVKAWKGSAVVIAEFATCFLAVTNAHVLRGASETSGALEYGKTRLHVVGRKRDGSETLPVRVSHVLSEGFLKKGLDLGLMVLDGPPDLRACRIAGQVASDGDWVFAVGHPGREKWFPAEGVLRDRSTHEGASALVHTALISGGSSGGGLFNHRCELVGINTWSGLSRRLTRSDEPVGIAIDIKELADACSVHYLEVSATTEWQRSGIRLEPGEMISVAAVGTWQLGRFAGRCGAAGMSGRARHSYAGEYPHGCLLVKDRGDYIRIPGLAYARSDGGEIRFRINDRDLGNNAGKLGVVLVRWK